jgi:hypothetical protein
MKKLVVVVVVVVVVCGILWHWLVLVTIQPGLFGEKKNVNLALCENLIVET